MLTGSLSHLLCRTVPFHKSRASYFRFARFNTSPIYYLRAWHRHQNNHNSNDLLLVRRKLACEYDLMSHMYTTYISLPICNRFFENQPNEICSHLSEKASKGRFPKPEKLQNHSNEGGEKKAMIALLGFIIVATLEIVWTEKVHLAVTFSKILLAT